MATELPGSGEHERDDDGDLLGAIIGPPLFRPCFVRLGSAHISPSSSSLIHAKRVFFWKVI
jgi:hypothetical protein